MRRDLIVRPGADRDVSEQVSYIEKDNPDAPERYAEAVVQSFADLAEMPGLGRVCEHAHRRLQGLRQYGVPGFRNYIIFYLPREDAVEIVRVLHGARNIESILEEEP